VTVSNEGTVEEGVEALLESLGFDPLTDLPPPSNGDSGLDLATCSPQDYLKTVLYPHLMPAMERVDIERPDDPVEFLALYLQKSASVQQKRTEELLELKGVKTRLRAELASELTVVGRV